MISCQKVNKNKLDMTAKRSKIESTVYKNNNLLAANSANLLFQAQAH
jgi:hypothetical protein